MNDLPSGLYDLLVTLALNATLRDDALEVAEGTVSDASAPELFADHIRALTVRTLKAAKDTGAGKLGAQVALANQFVAALAAISSDADTSVVDAGDAVLPSRLLQVRRKADRKLGTVTIERPGVPLRMSDLIVNGRGDLRVGREIQRELASADRVDVLVSFVKWSGFIELRDALQAFCDRHGAPPPMRLITTTYMGATDHEALDALQALGVDVRVSYDSRRTRLHAKAWLFHRATGFSTGVIGSSNLSHAALRDGCEWNVRLSRADNPSILRKFEATFAQYWDDPSFEPYERARFIEVKARRRNADVDAIASVANLHPYPHQREVLDALAEERAAGHTKNLVVAATGSGKTVIAALDYKRLAGRPSLLFVAHRAEILRQAQATYRAALRDGAFGEMLTGQDKPLVGRHVFATVQSLRNRRHTLAPDAYDVVVVDEFHHAEAATYTALLNHITPRYLLGLTATPERADGQSVLHWFDDRVAAEMRLWDALDQGLVAPFQYFGLHDGTDLSLVDFRAGRYAVSSLEALYTADEHRATAVLRSIHERVRSPREMKALGFCVSKRHAQYMAAFFQKNGLPAVALDSDSPHATRKNAVQDLMRGNVCTIFTVDLFNEGVDIPSVDTVLFLRPTESATVFLQQLGRGLRLEEGKPCLTVLDFVGNAHRDFRFDRRFAAMGVGSTRAEIRQAVEEGFPFLPAGCAITLDRETQDNVLRNLKRVLNRWRVLADDLPEDWPLDVFLQRAELTLEDVYRSGHTFTELRALRGYCAAPDKSALTRALQRTLHVDDPSRLTVWSALLADDTPPVADWLDPSQRMLFAVLGMGGRPVSELQRFYEELWETPDLLAEVRALFHVLDDRRRRPTFALDDLPLRMHATYSRDEIAAALNETRKGKLLRTQSGVFKCDQHRCDVLYVTLDKDEKDFAPTTLYNDYVMSRQRFHWETQGAVRADSNTAKRYRNPPEGWRTLLFVRQAKKDSRGETMPYLFLGPVTHESSEGERPMQVVWRLAHDIPAGWYNQVKIAAA